MSLSIPQYGNKKECFACIHIGFKKIIKINSAPSPAERFAFRFSIFAATYANAVEDRRQGSGSKQYGRGNKKPATSTANGKAMDKNPHFTRRQGQSKPLQESEQDPMEVDQSTAKFRHMIPQNRPKTAAFEPSVAKKKQNESERISGQRRQRVNNVAHQPEDPNKSYAVVAEQKMSAIDNEQSDSEDEQLNCLWDGPNCRSHSGSWVAKH